MSTMPSSGLVGVSHQMTRVRSVHAARTASTSLAPAAVHASPHRWKTWATRRYVPPYASPGITTWSPGWHTVRSSVSSAASPDANASPTAPASSAARHVSSAVRVGLAEREYS